MGQRVIGIVQARMGSTRLPGKALADVCGKPLLWYVVERLKQARGLDEVVLSIPADKELVEFAMDNRVPCCVGSENDLIARHYKTAKMRRADMVVRITADCPFVDPALVDRLVDIAQAQAFEYVCNVTPPTYPDGLDVEVMTSTLVKRAFINSGPKEGRHFAASVRKHALSYYNVERFIDLSHLRWTVDYEEDLEFARAVYSRLPPLCSSEAVLNLVILDEPWIGEINSMHKRGGLYD